MHEPIYTIEDEDTLLVGFDRRVSVLEQRRALLWFGPRVLHGRIPRELPEVNEWGPEHQPAKTIVYQNKYETYLRIIFFVSI
jgi:hypothetical protein